MSAQLAYAQVPAVESQASLSTPVARPKGLGWQGWSRHPLLFHLQCTLPHQWQQDSSALSSGASCYPSCAAIGSQCRGSVGLLEGEKQAVGVGKAVQSH